MQGQSTLMKKSRKLELCGDCRHPWAEHLGASYDAAVDGSCGECIYEAEHAGRTELCRRRAPDELTRGSRESFVIDVKPGTPGWPALLRTMRTDAVQVGLDIPESADWSQAEIEAANTLRRRAGIPRSSEAHYTAIPELATDDEVWSAFEVLAGRAHDAHVLRSSADWDPILDIADEGTSVVATVTPDGFEALVAAVGVDLIRPLPRRRHWRPWRRRPQ
ncbi:hypothetical protein GCM10022262_34940 [Georgenia daeguensis]|uniref:RES domain-containing protein n=1 Tax=Georgenia daeguensis TaxID=908355 RepID=A0ABP8EYR4_9MICO